VSSFGPQLQKISPFRATPVYIFNLVLLIISTQSISFVFPQNVHAVLFLAPLFYWIIQTPTMMPLWFVFLAGLTIDFGVGSALGLHAFGFILYYIVLYRSRRILLSQPFLYHMVVFLISALGFEILRWSVMSILQLSFVDAYPFLLGFVLNIVFCAPIMLVLKLLHRLISSHGR